MAQKILHDMQLDALVRELDKASEHDRPDLRDLKVASSRLPAPLKDVHPHDMKKVLNRLSEEYSYCLDHNETGTDRRGTAYSLRKLARLSAELNAVIVELPHLIVTHEIESEAESAWSFIAKWDFDFPEAGISQVPDNYAGKRFEFRQFTEQLAALALASQALAAEYDQPQPAHRPSNSLIQQMTDATVLCWAALSLLAGVTLSQCMPTGKNRGKSWCAEVLKMAMTNDWTNTSARPGWELVTIEREVPKSVKRLQETAAELIGAEPIAEWDQHGFDSIVGHFILYQALSSLHAGRFVQTPLHFDRFMQAMNDLQP